jgi:hypothetical protein
VILRIVETRIRQTCFDLDITKEKSSKILIRFFGINHSVAPAMTAVNVGSMRSMHVCIFDLD